MANKTPKTEKKKIVETLTHEEASRKNIPTAEFQSVMHKEEQRPVRVSWRIRQGLCCANKHNYCSALHLDGD